MTEPFTRYHEDKQIDSFSVRLNADERKQLEADKELLQQSKDSTALKQLAELGHVVLHDGKIGHYLRTVLGNVRKNRRLGISDFD